MQRRIKQLDHHINVFYDPDSDTYIKYYKDSYPFKKWWEVYKDYQKYESRTVQVLEVNFTKNYFVMENIKGINLEHEMIKLDFAESKEVLLQTMDIFNNFFKFQCKHLHNTEVFFHRDYRTENLIFDENKKVRLIDPNSFGNVPLDRMNNLLFFGRYMDTLTSIRERLSFAELTEEQKYRLGRGYLY